jgi:hypothetical protein
METAMKCLTLEGAAQEMEMEMVLAEARRMLEAQAGWVTDREAR